MIQVFLLLVLSFTSSAQAQKPATPPQTIDHWIKQSEKAFNASPHSRAVLKGVESLSNQAAATSLESPFSVTNELSATTYDKDPAATSLDLDKKFSDQLSLIYRRRNSFEASVSLTADQIAYRPPVTAPLAQSDESYTVAARISYDILKGGDHSEAAAQAKSQFFTLQRNALSQRANLFNQKIQFIQLMINLFAASCKIERLKNAEGVVGEAVENGRLQLKTRTLSYRDFLTFADLENSFSRRRIALESDIITLEKQISAWGSEPVALYQTLKSIKPICTGRFDAKLPANIENEAQKALAKHPTVQAADAALLAAQWAKKQIDVVDDVSLRPFGQIQRVKDQQEQAGVNNYTVGLTLQWNIGGTKANLNEDAAKIDEVAAKLEADRARADTFARIVSLHSQVTSQKLVHDILKRSITNSEELVRTLSVQRKIGQVDALNFANAHINLLESQNAVLDTWANIEKAAAELAEFAIPVGL